MDLKKLNQNKRMRKKKQWAHHILKMVQYDKMLCVDLPMEHAKYVLHSKQKIESRPLYWDLSKRYRSGNIPTSVPRVSVSQKQMGVHQFVSKQIVFTTKKKYWIIKATREEISFCVVTIQLQKHKLHTNTPLSPFSY